MIFFYYLLIYACLVTESKGLKYNYVHVFFFSFFLAKLNVLFFRFLSQDLSYFYSARVICYVILQQGVFAISCANWAAITALCHHLPH